MKVLIWLPCVPYPLDCGGNKAMFTMIDCMRKNHDVSIGLDILSHGAIRKAHSGKKKLVEELQGLWPDVKFYLYEGQSEYNENEVPVSKYCNTLLKLKESFTRKYRRAYQKWSLKNDNGDLSRAQSLLGDNLVKYNPGFIQFVQDISNRGFDAIQVEMYENLFLGYFLPKNVKRIFIHHELRFIRLENEMSLFKKLCHNDILAFKQLKAIEIAALREYSCIVTLTETDKKILSDFIPSDNIFSSPAAIVTSDKIYDFNPCSEFVFVGYGKHTPNAEGLQWLSEKVIPILRERNNHIKVYVVGSWSENQRRQYKDFPEIVFTGFVDDLSAFINGKISIVPLQIGSGMRIKIIEAMNAKSPVITTSKGIEGICEPQHDSDYIEADTDVEFANAMTLLISNIGKQQQIAENAYKCFRKYYSLEKMYSIRNNIYINNPN